MQPSNLRRQLLLAALALSAGIVTMMAASMVFSPQPETSRGLGQVRRLLQTRRLYADLATIGRLALCP